MGNYKPFTYTRAYISFIYSFLLNFKNFEELCRKEFFLDWVVELPKGRRGGFPANLKIQKEFKRNGKTEYGNCISKEWPVEDVEFGQDDAKVKATMESLTRIFENGSGVHTVTIDINSPSFENIHQAFSFVSLTEGKEPKYKISKDTTLFERFLHIISRIEVALESGEEVLDFQVVKKTDSETFQNPYVVTICEIDREEYEEAFKILNKSETEDNRPLRLKSKELASFLFRMIGGEKDWQKINYVFIRKYCEYDEKFGLLANMAMDTRLFLNFHKRSCLLIAYDLEKDPAKFVVPSLLNMIEMIRMRWHSLIIVNAMLDNALQKIKAESSKSNLYFLHDIFKLRKIFSNTLECPIIYSFEGGAITEISDIARTKLGINYLEDLTYKKFEVIDKLYEDSRDIVRFKEFDEHLKKIKKISGS